MKLLMHMCAVNVFHRRDDQRLGIIKAWYHLPLGYGYDGKWTAILTPAAELVLIRFFGNKITAAVNNTQALPAYQIGLKCAAYLELAE